MKPQSSDISDYLRATSVIDGNHLIVSKKARDIVGESTNDIEKAKQLFEWVRDRIPHSRDIGSRIVTCKASEVLERETGICYAKSHLLAAMCRSVGIPAGFCYQVCARKAPYTGTCTHGFNALYLHSIDEWVRCDARGNTGGINAQFDVEHEKLAFPIDPEKGNLFVYETVFAEPVPQVVDTLTRYDDREEMWWHLPPMIDDHLLSEEDRALNHTLKGTHQQNLRR